MPAKKRTQRPVGIIGLGLMGEVFARRLCNAGFDVVGFDIDAKKTARLETLAGGAAGSVAELARDCDPMVLAVFSTEQVEEVTERELLPALGEGSGRSVLCTSTCDPDRIAAL